jgi:hypothetical protein
MVEVGGSSGFQGIEEDQTLASKMEFSITYILGDVA